MSFTVQDITNYCLLMPF